MRRLSSCSLAGVLLTLSVGHYEPLLGQESPAPLVIDNWKEQREKLYREVFHMPPPPPSQELPIALLINGERKGTIHISYNANYTDFTFASQELLPTLKQLLSQSSYNLIESLASSGRLSWSHFAQVGFEATFKPAASQLQLLIPHEQLGQQQHYLRPLSSANPIKLHPPATLSGFINYDLEKRSSLTHQEGSHKTPLRLCLDGALNWRGAVLESQLRYRKGSSLKRGDTRLIIELSDTRQLLVGDLHYPTCGRQLFVKMTGLSLSKDFSLLSYRPLYQPSGEFDFFLEKECEVEIWLNQTLIGRRRLKPGQHSFKDLPYASGANEAELRIIGSDGTVQSIKLDLLQDSSCLAKGETQYSYNVGVTSEDRPSRSPFASLFYRQGLHPRLTASTYLQSKREQSLGGVSLTYLLPLCKMQWEGDISQIHGSHRGLFSQISLIRILPAGRSTSYSWRLFANYTSPHFAQIGQLHAEPVAKYKLGGYLHLPLTRSLSCALSACYNLNHNSYKPSYELSASLSSRIWKGLHVNCSLAQHKHHNGQLKRGLLLSLSWATSYPDGSLLANYRCDRGRSLCNLQAVYTPHDASPTAQPTFKTQLQVGPSCFTSGFEGRYRANHAEFSVGYKERYWKELPKQRELEGRIKGAIVFADGHWGASREVGSGGFVILKGIKNLEKTPLELFPGRYGPRAASSRLLGPAVYPRLSAYALNTTQIGISDLPPGVELASNRYSLFPTYKQGYLILLGSNPSYLVQGYLVDRHEHPIEHAVLAVTSCERPEDPPRLTFTGKRGRFILPALAAGRYQLQVEQHDQRFEKIVFTVEEAQQELQSLGKIVLEPLD